MTGPGAPAPDRTNALAHGAPAWRGHPLWLVGFRPFFLLAAAWAALLPPVWILMLSGALPAPAGAPPMQWHAHELFFGFGGAVLGGFLLTATKNWVQVRGWFGRPLQGLVAAWLFERLALWLGGGWPRPLLLVSTHLFFVALAGMVAWTLVRHRATDGYKDNVLFLVALPAMAAARVLLLDPAHFAEGKVMTLALFRLVFLVMLERTIPAFMKAGFQVVLPRVPAVDSSIKGIGLLLVAEPWLPRPAAAAAGFVLAALVLGRLATWKPLLAFRRLHVGVMYLGSLALAAQLAVAALDQVSPHAWVGPLPTHLFTLGVMGLIIPSMMLRLAKGHTGRPVVFGGVDHLVVALALLAFTARVVAPQLAPEAYQRWLWLAAGAWSLAFLVVLARIAPALWRPRIDGREH
jgi:uncharacterized protein involved in response to NO